MCRCSLATGCRWASNRSRSVGTMKRSYQIADEAGVLEAVLEARKLRERGA